MTRLLGMILAGGLCAGCGGNGVGLLFNLDILVVTNVKNTFEIAGVATSINGTRTYSWNTDKGQANLTIGSTLLNGSIRLEAFDENGTLVHDNTYKSGLIGAVSAFTKADGVAGTWSLRFTFNNAFFDGALVLKADEFDDPDAFSVGGTAALKVSWIYEPHWNTNQVHIDVGGMSSGKIRIRLWDGLGTLVHDVEYFGISGISDTATGSDGIWMVQIDFIDAVGAGAVTLGQ